MALKYLRPTIEMLAMDFNLLSGSGPEATSIGSPDVDNDAKECSIWDEVKQLNHKEERYEIYE